MTEHCSPIISHKREINGDLDFLVKLDHQWESFAKSEIILEIKKKKKTSQL